LKWDFEIKGEGRRFAALFCSIGLIQVAAYYLAAALVNGPGSLATPQPDTLLYCQAARRIVEGHAFSFSAATPVSSGTTSVLYPFVLALPYALGIKGGALVTAGFWLNAVFYLLFLGGWALAFWKWVSPKVAFGASVLLVVFPQPAYCALAQSDIGLWMAVSGLAAAALAHERMGWCAVLLGLGPWVRPEGILVTVAFAAAMVVLRRWASWWVVTVSLLSVVGVFIFNWLLTGAGGFSSVAAKGYFTTLPLPEALRSTAVAAVTMANDLLMGRASSFPRGFYTVPLIGAVAFWIGVARFEWSRKHWPVIVFCLAALGGFATVAQSGWQGTNTDRYLAWMMPLLVFFSAIGWCWGQERLSAFGWARFLLAVPVAYSVGAAAVLVGVYHLACMQTEAFVRFAHEVDRLIPANASVATIHFSGLAYYWGDRHVSNLSGIYSPEYESHDVCGLVETLMREPEKRLDYWLFFAQDNLPSEFLDKCGRSVLSGPEACVLKKMDWAALDAGAGDPVVAGKDMKWRVDVGYGRDELRSHLEIVYNYGMRPFDPIIDVADLNGKVAVECGRLVAGYSEMDVDGLLPGRDVTVVLRLKDRVQAVTRDAFGTAYNTDYSFEGSNGVHLAVDGREAVCAHVAVEKKGFSDLKIVLPGKFVTASRHRIRFHGDHAAFGYWFYQ